MPDSERHQNLYASFENQMIYRLASLEATVTNSLKRIDEKIDGFQKEFHHKHTNQEAKTAALEAKLEATKENNRLMWEQVRGEYDDRITKLEFFKTELVAKAMAVAAVIGLGWAVFGDLIQNTMGNLF